MKILFDQGTPVPLRRVLDGHEVHTVFEKGRKASVVKTIHSYHAKEAFP